MPYLEVQLTRKLHRIYDVSHDTTIGRAPQCSIQLLSRAVSRRHARLEFGEGGELVISDLGTKNGIKLDGRRIQGAAVIRDGAQLVVGDISMIYRAADRTVVDRDVVDLRDRPIAPEELEAAMGPKASFLIRSNADSITSFGANVARERISRLDVDELTRFKLQVALKEALDNAFIHGSGRDPNRDIQVTFYESDDEFVISVRDEGPGYEVERVLADAQEVDALEAIRNRDQMGKGLGLRIILNCVDRLQFEGRGATIHMARFKEAGQLFVISDDSDVASLPADEAPASLAAAPPLHPAPLAHTGLDDSDVTLDLDVDLGDLDSGTGPARPPFDEESEETSPLQPRSDEGPLSLDDLL